MDRIDDFKLPMPNELLMKFNFFELYPFDGGGNFINAEIIGEIDDQQVVENILTGALNDFGSLPVLDFAKFVLLSQISSFMRNGNYDTLL